MDCSYVGNTTRGFHTRIMEHTRLDKIYNKSAVQNYIFDCEKCTNKQNLMENFIIFKLCKADYLSKMHVALLINTINSSLNKQTFKNGAPFLGLKKILVTL